MKTPIIDESREHVHPLLAKPAANNKARKAETIKHWTEEEWALFLKPITNLMHRAALIVAYHRGLRAAETAAMMLSDYRAKDERLQVNRLKGSASGEYHLTSTESRALKAWIRIRGNEPGPLFRTRNGTGISQQMQDKLVKKYGALAGIAPDKCHVHALKHNCATHLLARGESLEDVQDHLGHRNIQSTQGYAKFTSPRRQARDKRLRDW